MKSEPRTVTLKFTVQEANMLATAAEAGIIHAYVYPANVRESVARLRAAAVKAMD